MIVVDHRQLPHSCALPYNYFITVEAAFWNHERMNCDSHDPAPQIGKPAQSIAYIQLVPGPAVGSEVEILYREGLANVISPGEGIVLEGELLDCPERDPEMGWVVIQEENGTVAAGSPALRELMIENSPCRLCLESVRVDDAHGCGSWDWRAFELSPNGGCIPVSDDGIG